MADIKPVETEEINNTVSNTTSNVVDEKNDIVKSDGDNEKEVAFSNDAQTPPRSTKRVIIERLILCTALFFPLFLATLDTSTSPFWTRLTLAIVATALPRMFITFTLANYRHCIVIWCTQRSIMDRKCLYPNKYCISPRIRSSRRYLRSSYRDAVRYIHLPCR